MSEQKINVAFEISYFLLLKDRCYKGSSVSWMQRRNVDITVPEVYDWNVLQIPCNTKLLKIEEYSLVAYLAQGTWEYFSLSLFRREKSCFFLSLRISHQCIFSENLVDHQDNFPCYILIYMFWEYGSTTKHHPQESSFILTYVQEFGVTSWLSRTKSIFLHVLIATT